MKSGHYTLIDLPSYVRPEWYEVAVNAVCSALMNHGKVRSVYRIGSVTAPGISDLDMVVVFRDEASTAYNPLAKLENESKYIFVHPLFGASESHFKEAAAITHFHNYRLIGGEDIFPQTKIPESDDKILRRQTALEFMIKMLFVMMMQKTYRIIKVRAFLLEARALEYDLEFLGLKNGPLYNLVQEIIELRKKWFLDSHAQKELVPAFDKLFDLLKDVLAGELQAAPVFTPGIQSGRFTKNVKWQQSSVLDITSRGLRIPSFPASFFSKKYFNFESRLTTFMVKLPVNKNCPSVLKNRYELSSAMAEYNKKHIPNFIPLTSSLRMM